MRVRRHLTIVLPDGPLVDELEAMRRRWDPAMAGGVPAHVSVVYPEEISDESLLLERVARAAPELRSFPLDVRGVDADDDRGGVFARVTDRTGALSQLKERLVAAPFRSSGFPLHVTIVHPRTSTQGPEAFAALSSDPISGSVLVSELGWTETSADAGMQVRRRFGLAPPRNQVVGAALRRGGRVLLGHRRADRTSFPDVWDLPGGHVEPGEHAADALARELREELGVAVTDLPAQPTIVVSDDALGVDLSVWFVDRWHGEPTNAAPEEHDALEWLDASEWRARPLAHAAYLDLLDRAFREV